MNVKPLIGFGLGIIAAGFMWRFYNDAITSFFSTYIIDSGDKYYLASNLFWNALPFIVIFLGVICLIFGSMSSISSSGGE